MIPHKYNPQAFLPVACSVAAAMLMLPATSVATEWKVVPTLSLIETYSDNIRLASPGNEKSDFVTQINPGISLTGTGPRLKVNARYAMQNLIYADESNRNTTRHLLNAGANAELVNDLLFLDGKASITQQNIATFGPTTDNVNITDNISETRTYSISPYMRNRYGSIASSELRYTHDSVEASTGGLLSSQSDRIQFGLNSGPAFKTLGWGLNYSNQQIDYTNARTIDMETISGNLRYMVSTKLSLNATGGYEKNNYLSIGAKPEGSFWSAGFSWAPMERTSITASAGKRFFGNTYSLTAKHRTRKTAWSLGYSEEITTTRSQFLIPATVDTASLLQQLFPDATPEQIEAFIIQNNLQTSVPDPINYFTNRVFLQKRLQASVAINGARNTLVLSVFDMVREAQTAQDMDSALLGSYSLTLNDDTRQTGTNATWNWRITPLTSANASAGYTRMNWPVTGRKDDIKTIRLGLARQFQPKLRGSVDYRHIQRDSSQSGGDYRENAVTASVHMSF
jgi:uncharacterized protein (PEP-CTERM system associated)